MAIHPIQVKYSFFKQWVFWGLFLPVLMVLLMPLFIKHLPHVEKEYDSFQSLGISHRAVNQKANQIFEQMFIESGIYTATQRLFVAKTPTGHTNTFNSHTTSWFYILWWRIYHGIWRCYLWIKAFDVLFLCLLISVGGDAFVIRKERSKQDAIHSPSLFYLSSHVLMGACGLLHTLLFIHYTITAGIVFGVLMIILVALWIRIYSFKS